MKLVGVDEIGAKLGRSRQRVYALARDGILPSVRLGRSLLFDEEAVDAFIRSGGRALPGGWRRDPLDVEPGAPR